MEENLKVEQPFRAGDPCGAAGIGTGGGSRAPAAREGRGTAKKKDAVKEALKKCAVGLRTSEVVEEFTVEDGQLVLVKKKVTKREIPPDIKAVKMLLEAETPSELTDEQLEAEKAKLIKMIKEDNFE